MAVRADGRFHCAAGECEKPSVNVVFGMPPTATPFLTPPVMAIEGEEMKIPKPVPSAGDPGNLCGFSGQQTWPRRISRHEATTALRTMRSRARRNDGRLVRNALGDYTLIGLNTVELLTR